MTGKEKTAPPSSAEGEKWWRKLRLSASPGLKKGLWLCFQTLLGYMGGSVELFGGCSPFGIALTARCEDTASGLCTLLGAGTAVLATKGLNDAVRYEAALLLVFTVNFVMRDTPAVEKSWFMPAAAGLITAITGTLGFFDTLSPLRTGVHLLTEVLSAGLSTYLFTLTFRKRSARSEEEERRTEIGRTLLLCCAVMSLCRVRLWGDMLVGRIAAMGLVLLYACGGAAAGSTAGVLMGLCVDMAAGDTPLYALCFPFSGLMAGLAARKGRLLFVLCFALSNCVTLLWNWEQGAGAGCFYELALVGAVFLSLPARLLSDLTELLCLRPRNGGEALLRRYSARRTAELAGAFRELYDTVTKKVEGEHNDRNVATIYDRAAETVCASCPKKGECWHRDYVDMLSMLNEATESLHRCGVLRASDLPERFPARCERSEAFLEAVNEEARAMAYRRRLRARLEESASAAYGQFRCLSAVLESAAEDMRGMGSPEPHAERRILRYLHALEIDAEVSVFRSRSGRLRLVIESAQCAALQRREDYLSELSALLGVKLCRIAGINGDAGLLILSEAEPLCASVGIAAAKKEGERVSGDLGTYFKTEEGVLCVLLSDGMGSGEEAAGESLATVRILERFLRSGVEPSTALKLLNSVMLLKDSENWGYATVDLLCIDLFSGEAGFYKYGAAPSYVRMGRSVRRLRGVSVAAGLLNGDGEAPDELHVTLSAGAVAVLGSDGAVSPDTDASLRAALLDFSGDDPRELARELLRRSREEYGNEDDMTLLVVKLEEKSA